MPAGVKPILGAKQSIRLRWEDCATGVPTPMVRAVPPTLVQRAARVESAVPVTHVKHALRMQTALPLARVLTAVPVVEVAHASQEVSLTANVEKDLCYTLFSIGLICPTSPMQMLAIRARTVAIVLPATATVRPWSV